MNHHLTIENGHEETINLMIPIRAGMEKELLDTICHLQEANMPVVITHGTMTDEAYRENNIKSVMYGECCSRKVATAIVDEVDSDIIAAMEEAEENDTRIDDSSYEPYTVDLVDEKQLSFDDTKVDEKHLPSTYNKNKE